MLEQIDKWLRDQKRQYAFGLAIFLALASIEVKKKYADYLRSGEDEEVAPTDPRFPMLINKVTAIFNIVRNDPDKYKEAMSTLAAPVIKTNDQVKQIVALKEETEALQAQIDELQESEEDKAVEIDELQEEIEAKDSEIDELKAKLKEKGVRVLDGKDLPTGTKKKYDRIKAIIPEMAAIHGELKDTGLTDEQRKAKADDLCKLDDERRALWDDIDEYLKDYNTELAEVKENEYSEDPLIRGAQMAYRVMRLKENIKRNTDSAAKYKESGKPDFEQKALDKVAAMQKELDELETILNEKK